MIQGFKQYNICACIKQNLDGLRVAMQGSLMQRCVVPPAGGLPNLKTQSILNHLWRDSPGQVATQCRLDVLVSQQALQRSSYVAAVKDQTGTA